MKIVLYHDHCQDGFFSAYLAWKYFQDDSVKFISVSHRPVLDLDPLESLNFILKQKHHKTHLFAKRKNINTAAAKYKVKNN